MHDSGLAMRPLRSRALGVAPGQVHEPGQVPGPRPRPRHTPTHTLTRTHAFTLHLISPRLIPATPKQSTARSPRCCSLPHVVGGCGSDLAGAGPLQGTKSTAASLVQFCCFLPVFALADMVSRLTFSWAACSQIAAAAVGWSAPGLCCIGAAFGAVFGACSAATATPCTLQQKSLHFTSFG